MNSPVDHVILTRFNLPSIGSESLIRAKEGWLRDRIQLFERYCLPSVLAQTNSDFFWIIYLDPESPTWLKRRMEELSTGNAFKAIYRAEVSNEDLVADIRNLVGSQKDHLMTTNLDNDDGLASTFVEQLHTVPMDGSRTAIYLTRGLILSGNKLFLRTDRANAFCSVRETWDGPETCWADWHNQLGKSMPAREISGTPAWLQVVHDLNVSNRVRGTRVDPKAFVSSFGELLDDARRPSRAEILIERLALRPFRSIRESGRAVTKATILVVFGRGGLDRIKSTMNRKINFKYFSKSNAQSNANPTSR
ncbi:glycosyltransferase [Pseudarthrobacter sp. PS3-L1]|uniref:glycosyltransferase n=1 Tax=Pseudarthrobacter sp. PS3-L1 TaxID=3046207 RepID=UPI0024BA104E|nr:glycosyltransferase [Pseudarthrobacter sp. PS3-L1]MDJ0320999.1 glycosyltransferase [Pseudarthrobacter sp. PS3-L1]